MTKEEAECLTSWIWAIAWYELEQTARKPIKMTEHTQKRFVKILQHTMAVLSKRLVGYFPETRT